MVPGNNIGDFASVDELLLLSPPNRNFCPGQMWICHHSCDKRDTKKKNKVHVIFINYKIKQIPKIDILCS